MSSESFENHIRSHALHIADYLQSLPPHEQLMVLEEAQRIYHERHESPHRAQGQDDVMFSLGQWLAQVFLRLSPPARAGLIEVAKRLDDAERFDRLVDLDE
jgi:hypothetical protein